MEVCDDVLRKSAYVILPSGCSRHHVLGAAMFAVLILMPFRHSRHKWMSTDKCDFCGPHLIAYGLVANRCCREIIASFTYQELEILINCHTAN